MAIVRRPSCALLLAAAVGATSHGPAVAGAERAPQAAPRMMTDSEPRVRIRGVPAGGGLDRGQFARWIREHGVLFDAVPSPTIMTQAFDRADHDRDGRISARELADALIKPGSGIAMRQAH